tara:strand:- start:614 stop:1591 length:978 start_codon:yes stop_codon:yes gene_type:complete
MSKYNLGLKFKENVLRLSSLTIAQKLELLENLANEEGEEDIEILKVVVRTKNVFDLFLKDEKNEEEKVKIKNEIYRLEKFFNQSKTLELCDFMSAFDPFYSDVKDEILLPKEEKNILDTKNKSSIQNQDINGRSKSNNNNVMSKLQSFGGSFGSFLFIVGIFTLKDIIRANLSFWFRINRMELGFIQAKLFSAGSLALGGIILASYGFVAMELFSRSSTEIKIIPKETLKPFQQRQKNSKPWLIGILVGLVSPLFFSLIYAVRHKDWRIFVYPMWIFLSVALLLSPLLFELNSYKIYLQIFSGFIAYVIVRNNKSSIKIEDNTSI